eukprot:93204-Pelagomonas_calceolata.AAC.1
MTPIKEKRIPRTKALWVGLSALPKGGRKLNRIAPAGDQVWTVVQNCAYSCGPHAFSWLADDWLKLFTRPFPDGRGGFLDNCCLIHVALLSAFQ